MDEQHDHRLIEAPRTGREAAGEALLRGQALLLDVRTPEEYRFSHAPGAVNIPLRELPDRLDEVPRGRPVITVCT